MKFLIPFFALTALCSGFALADDAVTFDEHVKPLLRKHCTACHGEDKQKAGLNLQTYGASLKGGSGGEVILAGRASQSLLWQVLTDEDPEYRMPPEKPPLSEDEVALVQRWIDGGMIEKAGGKSMVESRDLTFKPAPKNADGEPVLPGELPAVKVRETSIRLPVLAMDSSPNAPIVAVAGQEYISLMNTETEEEHGKLAFPEGVPHVIRFSPDGSVLLVAGGKPVESGKVVLFDVKSGKRLKEVGDEIDAVLAADLSPDQTRVALGGSGKVVKVYSTADGALQFKLDKHTDWITSIAFSPDGKYLATGDRAGGLHLWDASTGGLALNLLEHTEAVTALDWRGDSRLLASAGDDGSVIWWDVKDGFPAIKKEKAHPRPREEGEFLSPPNGVLAVSFSTDGNLVSAGRDRGVNYWDAKGEKTKNYRIDEATPVSTSVTFDNQRIIAGYTDGSVRFWNAK